MKEKWVLKIVQIWSICCCCRKSKTRQKNEEEAKFFTVKFHRCKNIRIFTQTNDKENDFLFTFFSESGGQTRWGKFSPSLFFFSFMNTRKLSFSLSSRKVFSSLVSDSTKKLQRVFRRSKPKSLKTWKSFKISSRRKEQEKLWWCENIYFPFSEIQSKTLFSNFCVFLKFVLRHSKKSYLQWRKKNNWNVGYRSILTDLQYFFLCCYKTSYNIKTKLNQKQKKLYLKIES